MKQKNEDTRRGQVWRGRPQAPLHGGFCRAILLSEMWLDSVFCLKFLVQTVLCVVLSMGYLLLPFVPMSHCSELKSAVSLVKYCRVSGEESCSAATNFWLNHGNLCFLSCKGDLLIGTAALRMSTSLSNEYND